jgi:hypothetical protein
MIFRALACDYDGTLATNDRIGPAALEALGRACDLGLKLILVTGRTFFDLNRVCEQLDLFDAVVAENGGVLYDPRSGALQDQAPPPPSSLLAELDRRDIWYQLGRVVVDVSRQDEAAVQEALTAIRVSRELVYNRGALMLLPAGISKGTGVRQVIRGLGLSFHDVLALGDAENDREFFGACGWTACPGDAVALLRDQADWVFPGENGSSIARAITGPILSGKLPLHLSPRHRLALGWAMGSADPVTIPARGVNVLVHGDSLSGKSWLLGAIVERLVAERYAVCVLDPEGDYRVLGGLSGVICEEVNDEADMARAVDHFDTNPAACVVADLSNQRYSDKVRITWAGLEMLVEARRRHGVPHWIIVDEAHYSLHREGIPAKVLPPDMTGLCLASYRSSWIQAQVTERMNVYILARTTDAKELDFLRTSLAAAGVDSEAVVSALPDLPVGQFILVHPGLTDRSVLISFTPPRREMAHVRHLTKYADTEVSPDRRFIFRAPDAGEVGCARSLADFMEALEHIDPAVLDGHARHGDFSRWVRDVFSDKELGRQLRKAEYRWARGELTDLVRGLAVPIRARYDAQ